MAARPMRAFQVPHDSCRMTTGEPNATSGDSVDAIMAIMASAFDSSFGEAWTRRQVEDALMLGKCHYLVFGSHGEAWTPGDVPAGFSLSRSTCDEEELLLFAVAPNCRGRGIGTHMLEQFAAQARLRGARRLLLEMRRGNRAQGLYERFGFSIVGERPNYYRVAGGTTIDALTFACTCN